MQTLCSKYYGHSHSHSLFTLNLLTDTTRIADAIAIGNAPLITGPFLAFLHSINNPDVISFAGEWSLATAFNTTFDFLRKWGDAQKLTYVEGSGWTFW